MTYASNLIGSFLTIFHPSGHFCGIIKSASQKSDTVRSRLRSFVILELTRFSESQHCKAFFEKFHPTMPMLHEPTFDLEKASESLIKAVTCIGLLYGPAESRLAASRKLFEKCYSSLEEYVSTNFRQHFCIAS